MFSRSVSGQVGWCKRLVVQNESGRGRQLTKQRGWPFTLQLAGVVDLVDTRGSNPREAYASGRFDSGRLHPSENVCSSPWANGAAS